MKILLIEPSTGEIGITSFEYPPMGLTALAAYIRSKGHAVSIYDANLAKATVKQVKNIVRKINPDIVGISSMSLTINTTFKIATAIKSLDLKISVIVGGIHPTVCPTHTLSNIAIDAIVIGEGELTAIELIDAIKYGRDLSKIKGIGFRKNNKVIINLRRELIPIMDELPIPAYDLIPLNRYRSPYATRSPFAAIMRSRGCIFNCTFCSNSKTFGQTFRCQSPQRTIEEITYLKKNFNIKELSFKDTELTLDKNLETFCDVLIHKKFDIIWSCNGRASNVNQNLLKKMKRAGCVSITYGIESGDETILKNIKKPIRLEDAHRAVTLTKEAGIKVVTNFMIGNPGDTKETIEKTIELAVKLSPDYAYFGFTTPFPGTELREQAKKNNWMLAEDMDVIRYDDCIMNATSLSTEELNTCLDTAYRRFYFRLPYIIKRLRNFRLNEARISLRGLRSIVNNTYRVRITKRRLGGRK